MDKLQIRNFLLLSRRSYVAEKENLYKQAASSVVKNANDLDMTEKDKSFWMKDPKTGYWIPESHFDQNDVADMRAKFLVKKDKF